MLHLILHIDHFPFDRDPIYKKFFIVKKSGFIIIYDMATYNKDEVHKVQEGVNKVNIKVELDWKG